MGCRERGARFCSRLAIDRPQLVISSCCSPWGSACGANLLVVWFFAVINLSYLCQLHTRLEETQSFSSQELVAILYRRAHVCETSFKIIIGRIYITFRRQVGVDLTSPFPKDFKSALNIKQWCGSTSSSMPRLEVILSSVCTVFKTHAWCCSSQESSNILINFKQE